MTENYYIRLKKQTVKTLIEKIKLNMNTKTTLKGRKATYQTILSGNMHELAQFVIGKNKALSSDIPALAIKRNDTIDVQQRIRVMTPAEQKRVGTSKSGLWYQKEKVAEGRKIKVYSKVLSKLI